MKGLSREENKKLLLKCLKKNRGMISISCEEVNVSRQTYHNYLKTDPDFREKVMAIHQAQGDMVETKLFEAIEAGDIRAIMFYLKLKGRDRGYTTTIDVYTPDPIQIRYITPNDDSDSADKGEI